MKVQVLAAVAAAVCATMSASAVASAASPTFAEASSASIRPGAMTFTDGSQCTSNFVFYDDSTVYLGQAAHCSGTGGADETNGCLAKSLAVGTPVEIAGASRPGRLAYNSWVTMQAIGEKDTDACQYNDFALVAIDPADAGKVSPSVPTFGVPTGLNMSGTAAGDAVSSYGNSQLRGGTALLSPKFGFALGQEAGGWNHSVLTVTPGIPGDSGSGFLDARGRAFGVLSTLSLLPLPGTNGVSDLSRALSYMRGHGGPGVVLADTTRAAPPAAAAAAPAAGSKPAARKRSATRSRPRPSQAKKRRAVICKKRKSSRVRCSKPRARARKSARTR